MREHLTLSGVAPDFGPGFARRAETLHLRGDSDQALRLLVSGIEARPRDPTARLVLARVCRDTGREAEAQEWLEDALRVDPECPGALRALIDILGDASADYRELLAAREPWNEVPAAPFGTQAPAMGRVVNEPRAARGGLSSPIAFPARDEEEEPEIEENSAPHVATVTLAEIYFQQGLKEQAAQIYRQLLERQPGDDSVRRRLQEIEGN